MPNGGEGDDQSRSIRGSSRRSKPAPSSLVRTNVELTEAREPGGSRIDRSTDARSRFAAGHRRVNSDCNLFDDSLGCVGWFASGTCPGDSLDP